MHRDNFSSLFHITSTGVPNGEKEKRDSNAFVYANKACGILDFKNDISHVFQGQFH